MKKDELLHKIDEAMRTEESAVPIYLENYAAALAWVGLDPALQRLIADSFQTMAKDSKQHKRILVKIRRTVLEAERDVL